MPGKLHQGTLELFRDDPWLAFDLLGVERPVAGTPVDLRGEVERDDPDEPDKTQVRYPDLVLVYQDEEDVEVGVVIAVEAQGELDRHKRWRLPYYQAVLADEYELATFMVVVSFHVRMSAALREWARGLPPQVDVLLLDADTVPRILELDVARARPTAAVLSATVHACRGDVEVARVAIRACNGLPEKKRESYIGTILAAVDESQRAELEAERNMERTSDIWEIERRSGSFVYGRKEGLEEGRREGREEGRQATLVEMIEALLDVRGIAMTPKQVEQLRSCEQLATLERWARRARDVSDAEALFADD